MPADEAEDVIVARVDDLGLATGKDRVPGPQADEVAQPGVESALDGGGIVPARERDGVVARAVDPAAVTALGWIILVGVIVDGGDFVAQIDQRDAADQQRYPVEEEDAPEGNINLGRIVLTQALFDAGERGGCAGDAGITGARVLLEGHA